MGDSALLIDATLLAVPAAASPAAIGFLTRMNAAAVGLGVLGVVDLAPWQAAGVRFDHHWIERSPWSAKVLLVALRDLAAQGAMSWLVTSETASIVPAATAGLAGVVVVGAPLPAPSASISITSADDLGDLPRALVPRGGGCWHDR